MNPFENITVYSSDPLTIHEPKKPEIEEATIAHVQTDVDKEHAKAQFEIFSCTNPSHLVTLEKEVRQAIPEETLKKITEIQKKAVDHTVFKERERIDQWIECILVDPTHRLPKAQEIAKALEKGLEPDAKELYKQIANSATTQLTNYKKRFIKLDNAVDIIEVAVRIALHAYYTAWYCKNDIKEISPEYLRQLALTSEHVQEEEIKKIEVTFKPQDMSEIPENTLNEITKELEWMASALNTERPVEYLVADPTTRIPEVKKELKEWEEEFDQETRALYTLLANAAKVRVLKQNRVFPFIILDNGNEIVELAVKRVLCCGDKIKYHASKIRGMSPQYLQRLAKEAT